MYDIIIIGTGAGGGTLAHKLASSGKKILIIERGGYVPREKENWDTEEVFNKERYHTHETWIDKNGKKFRPGTSYFVGGNTKFYGAALFRLREKDFEILQHKDGISPEWPLKYKDFEAYYDEAEKLYSVNGLRGEDPTDPHSNVAYPNPPLTHEPRIQKLNDDIQKLGLHPFHIPMGVIQDKNRAAAPYQLDRFDGYPDPTELKADSHVCGIKPALEHQNVELVINTKVEKLLTDDSGKNVTSVLCSHEGKEIIYEGKIIIVSCGAVNSAALLLKSKNEKHPNGLANSSDLVGRNYMHHNNSAMVALSKEENKTTFGKTLAVNDFYFGDKEYDFPIGHIQMLAKSDAAQFKADAPGFTPMFTLEKMAKHALDFWLTTEDLPNPNNRVKVDDNGNIHLEYTENNLESHKKLVEKLKWILENSGCETHLLPNNIYLGKKIPLAGVAHQCGTMRFGNDPKNSVLDINCKAHDLNNLFVVDGSFFPSSAAVNPALTIMANALRVGDFINANF
jgi:choline dehydrogenase-like flavoprotein